MNWYNISYTTYINLFVREYYNWLTIKFHVLEVIPFRYLNKEEDIGVQADGCDTAHGGFSYGERNNGEVTVLDFVIFYELLVVNSLFKKKEDHLVTFKSGSIKTQIDHFLIRANRRRFCKDCKVIPSEYLGTQHRLLVLDVELKCSKWKKRSVGEPRVKWWNLTKENTIKGLFFSWVNPHLPISTYFNLLQPISTHLKQKYQLQPTSTCLNLFQPTSTNFNPPLHNFNNL